MGEVLKADDGEGTSQGHRLGRIDSRQQKLAAFEAPGKLRHGEPTADGADRSVQAELSTDQSAVQDLLREGGWSRARQGAPVTAESVKLRREESYRYENGAERQSLRSRKGLSEGGNGEGGRKWFQGKGL